uniref:Uncharacterized protein n=1 Tax=Setaria viridis TaxID=4556 RepID=A0A4U6WSK1_SETVI|nr:hypothetical protein SEVIR_1G364900v2 [Setaria viridis]
MIFLSVRGGWLGGGWGRGWRSGRCRWDREPSYHNPRCVWFDGWIGYYGRAGPYYVGGPVAFLGSSPAQQLNHSACCPPSTSTSLLLVVLAFFPLLYATENKPGARQPGPFVSITSLLMIAAVQIRFTPT